jgi:hypothetical protein
MMMLPLAFSDISDGLEAWFAVSGNGFVVLAVVALGLLPSLVSMLMQITSRR